MLARPGGIYFETYDGLKKRVAPVARNLHPGGALPSSLTSQPCFFHKRGPIDEC
jgi:hypothetical protein